MLKDVPTTEYQIPNTKYLCGQTGERAHGRTGYWMLDACPSA
ncbi:hypothetical protein D3OALGA1CA_5198 [Olavius algarvensis associated proteobacterium Delta 3]|nr:hypothetical protein D3OALGA1CA_5198 [Olavius algarvensis associated proteobacterium Delta 3]